MRVVIDENIFGASAFLADSEARSRRGFSDFRTVARRALQKLRPIVVRN